MINRLILLDIQMHLRQPEITLITGPRQSGKTTLMNILMNDLDKKGEKCLFLSMDFESDKSFFSSQDALIHRVQLEFGDHPGYVFLDEIQRKENAGIFLKGLYDMRLPWKMIVSGSGSIELKEKVSESLAGRKRIFEVRPVSFHEFLDFRTNYNNAGNVYSYSQLFPVKAMELLNEYLNFGGYPRVILAATVREKLLEINEIFQSYIDRDIRPLIPGDHPEAYIRLIRLLAAQTGQLVNLSNLSNEAGITMPTVLKHLWIAEKTYFIKLIQPFYCNIRKEITKSPVIYFADHGMRNFAISAFGTIHRPKETGFVFQNLVGNILLSELFATPFVVHFYRTTDKAEVDFIISRPDDPIGVEVKFTSIRNPVISRSLRNFINKYHPSEAWVVNLSFSGSIMVGKTRVRFISFFGLPDVIHDLVGSIERNYMIEEKKFPYRILRQKSRK